MKSYLALSFVVTGMLACSKQKQQPTTVASPTVRSPAATRPEPTGTSVATGDMRQLLLHLQRVHFAFDSTTLLPDARKALEAAAAILAANPGIQLYVDGHTDLRGTTEYNLGLGDRRARVVIDYLARLGIDRGRLQAMTFGAERPLRQGEGVEEHAVNRRVEFRLLRGELELVLDPGTPFDDRGQPLAVASP